MPEGDVKTTHRYTDIPSDGHTKRRLGISIVFEKTGNNFLILNGDAVSEIYEFQTYLTRLDAGEYIIVVTISGSNLSSPIIKYFTMKSKDAIVSLNIKKNGAKWLKNQRQEVKESLWH